MEVYFIIPLSRRRCLVMLVISLSTSNTPDPGATMITVWPVRPKLRSMWCLSKAETKNSENKMRNYQPGIETESNQGLHWVHSTLLCDWSNDLKNLHRSLDQQDGKRTPVTAHHSHFPALQKVFLLLLWVLFGSWSLLFSFSCSDSKFSLLWFCMRDTWSKCVLWLSLTPT